MLTPERNIMLTDSQVAAIAIAKDELQSYVEIIGQESSLDDEEMPSPKLYWALRVLDELLNEQALEAAKS